MSPYCHTPWSCNLPSNAATHRAPRVIGRGTERLVTKQALARSNLSL
jgi:hypothetical protein